jgi:broad specificity phosphatase PhoE
MSIPGLRDASLVLVRHGRTTWVEEGRFQGAADVPLYAHGRTQAAAVADRQDEPLAITELPLREGAGGVIRHSPLSRAADTAHAIARARGTSDVLVIDDDLREIAQGEWEGLRHEQVMTGWPRDLALWRQDPLHHHAPGGESLEEASARAARATARMLADLGTSLRPAADSGTGQSAVLGYGEPPGPGAEPIVAEHDPWSITVAHDGILRLVLLGLLDLPLDRYWAFPFALCAITVVEMRAGRARLRAHNLEAHLAEDEPARPPASSR